MKAASDTDCARLLKLLGDPKRLAILRLIFHEPRCVSEIEQALSLPQYEVSRHLGILRRAGVVEPRREAQRTYYSVAKDAKLTLDSEALEFGCCRLEFPTPRRG
jgi:DNA-binding transcriptional ArsR family regulator